MPTLNPKISVIVPVYNVEKYLRRCVDSILAQTFTDFELLLIDDGSTDGSRKICDEYAEKDSRVRVFHKENGGVASARQLGIEKALGLYSIHADSDDWIEPSMLGDMFVSMTKSNADILISDYYEQHNGNAIYIEQNIKDDCADEEILRDILLGKLFGALWHKMIRHSLYKTYDVHFISGINYCEDVLVFTQLLQHPVKVCHLDKAYYHYDQSNTDSITRKYTLETFKMRQKFLESLTKILPERLNDLIPIIAYGIKHEAFEHNCLTKQCFNGYYPTTLSVILKNRNGGRFNLLCMILAWCGMFNFAEVLYNRYKETKRLITSK